MSRNVEDEQIFVKVNVRFCLSCAFCCHSNTAKSDQWYKHPKQPNKSYCTWRMFFRFHTNSIESWVNRTIRGEDGPRHSGIAGFVVADSLPVRVSRGNTHFPSFSRLLPKSYSPSPVPEPGSFSPCGDRRQHRDRRRMPAECVCMSVCVSAQECV